MPLVGPVEKGQSQQAMLSRRAGYALSVDPESEPRELLGLPAFGFADPGPLRDALTAAVLVGAKTATTSLLVEYVIDGVPLPKLGDRSLVYDSERRPVAVIETTSSEIATIVTVRDEFARAEGERYADAAGWRVAHEHYWNRWLDYYRDRLRDPEFALTNSTLVVCERFRLVERLEP